MNPPPRRPDDHDLPPLPPQSGEATRPAGDDSAVIPGEPTPALDDPLPVADLVARDPLLDDPLFAELVKPSPTPDISLEPAATGGPTPLFAEPVTGAAGVDLPVARPVRAVPVRPPAAPEVLDAVPVEGPAPAPPLPQAHPVRPATPPSVWPRPPVAAGPRRESTPPPTGAAELRSRPLAACGVIGCLAVVVVGSLGFLAFVAISVLGHLGDRIADQTRGRQGMTGEARPGPVAPTTLAQNITLKLPGQVDAVGRGAGGRYLFLRIPSKRELAVFDPNSGEVLTYLPVGEQTALFAGGAAKLFVCKPKEGVIERYDLVTWKREQTVPIPAGTTRVEAVAIGSRSDGPVYLFSGGGGGRPGSVRLIDATTLEPIGPPRPTTEWEEPADGRAHARASDDGTVVGLAGNRKAILFRFDADGFHEHPLRGEDDPPLFATPAPDGDYVYTPRGVFRTSGTRIARPDGDYFYTFPAAQGNAVYLSLDVSRAGQLRGPLKLHFPGPSRQTVGTLKIPIPGGMEADDVRDITPDQRIHVWPAAGLAAVLLPSNDRIELHKVDLAAAVKSVGGDYVVIGSDPPTTAHPGTEWRYAPAVWTRSGQARLEVRAGPPDMRVRGGDIIWTPPPGFAEDSVEVRVQASEGPADQNPHTFEQKFRIFMVTSPGR